MSVVERRRLLRAAYAQAEAMDPAEYAAILRHRPAHLLKAEEFVPWVATVILWAKDGEPLHFAAYRLRMYLVAYAETSGYALTLPTVIARALERLTQDGWHQNPTGRQ